MRLLALISLFALLGLAHSDAADSAITDLETSKAQYTTKVLAAKAELSATMARLVEAERTNTRISAEQKVAIVTLLESERSQFLEHGRLPNRIRLRRDIAKYLQAMRLARTKLESAFDKAIRHYADAGEIEGARRLLDQKSEFQKSGSLTPMASVFGLHTEATKICFIVDSSSSLDNKLFIDIKDELRDCIGRMSETTSFQLIFYRRDRITLPGLAGDALKLEPATQAMKSHADKWIRSISRARGGPPTPAFQMAASLSPNVVFFVSDGGFGTDAPDQIVKIARDKQFRVFAVGVGRDVRTERLARIAQLTNGAYREIQVND